MGVAGPGGSSDTGGADGSRVGALCALQCWGETLREGGTR